MYQRWDADGRRRPGGQPPGRAASCARRPVIGGFIKAATADEIPAGSARRVEPGGNSLAVFNCGGEFFAIDNTCTHDGGPLAQGELDELEITCPWHGAVFDVRTGAVLGPPAGENVIS